MNLNDPKVVLRLAREEAMAHMRERGDTYVKIGKRFNVTPWRINQILRDRERRLRRYRPVASEIDLSAIAI